MDVPFDRDGAWHSCLRLPLSSDESAYGAVLIPITVVRNGAGATFLLTAGNHGDEYEGQIALTRLAQEITPDQITGRLIIIPALNTPAARAGRRTSPLDGKDLSRCFPGDPEGTPTEAIADYVGSILHPMADYAIDLHSGGRSLLYLPSVLMRLTGDPRRDGQTLDLGRTLGTPFGQILAGGGDGRTLSSSAGRAGVVWLSTELGGAGMVSPAIMPIVSAGLRRVLRRVGILAGGPDDDPGPQRLLAVGGAESQVMAPEAGVFEPFDDLGDTVAGGAAAGELLFPETPRRPPVRLRHPHDGIVVCRRALGRCGPGDCLVLLGRPWQP